MYVHMYIAIGHIKFVISFPDVPHAQYRSHVIMCNADADVTHDDPRKRINVMGPGSGDRSRDTQCSSLKEFFPIHLV